MAEIPVLISQTWRVAKSENSAALLRKVLAASGDLGPPLVTFLAMDSPVGAAASATARAVKKFPELAPLATDGWLRLVENLCVVVDDLERTFVAEIEAVAGPAPGWFEPGR